MIVYAFPVCADSIFEPGRIILRFLLTLHAQSAVGKYVESFDRDLSGTPGTDPVLTLLDSLQCVLDLSEFAGFQLGKLRRQFFSSVSEGGISRVARRGRRFSLTQIGEFSAQSLKEFAATG